MSLFNHGWIGLGGEPVTGRVPPSLVSNAPLSALQEGAVFHAFKLFCDAVNGSTLPNGYHAAHRLLADGTKVSMQANGGVYTVRVEVPPPQKEQEHFRGFVIIPKYPEADRAMLIRALTLNGNHLWRRWVQNYRPGGNSAPTYWVDAPKRTKLRGVTILEDDNYSDVYLQGDQKLILNGNRTASGFTTNDRMLPVPIRDISAMPPIQMWFGLKDNSVSVYDSTLPHPAITELWARSALPEFTDGVTFLPGVRYDAASRRASFLNIGLRDAGSTQIRRGDVTLLTTAPWASISAPNNDIMGVPSYMGFTEGASRVVYWPEGPYESFDTTGLILGTADGAPIFSSQPVPQYQRTKDHATRNITVNDSIELYPGISATCSRTSFVDSTYEIGGGNWMGIWSGPYTFCAGEIPQAGIYGAALYPLDIAGAGPIVPGEQRGIVGIETGETIEHSDTATVSTTVGGHTIFTSTMTHHITHKELSHREVASIVFAGGGGLTSTPNQWFVCWHWEYRTPEWHSAEQAWYKGWEWYYGTENLIKIQTSDKTWTSPIAKVIFNETISVTAESKDYLLYDEENSAFVYLKGTLTANETKTLAGFDATINIALSIVIESPILNKSVEVKTWTITGLEPNVNLTRPDDPDEYYYNITWQFCLPLQVRPAFNPAWFHQGLCPYIAYTTAAEAMTEATGTVPAVPAPNFEHHLIASFRLRVLYASRPEGYLPYVPDAMTVPAPMFEQMVHYHLGLSWYFHVSDLEGLALSMNASAPGQSAFSDLGLSTINAEVYRT